MALAEREMRLLGQPALFIVKDGQVGLDRALANRRYRVVDPVAVLAAPAGKPAGVLPQSGQAVFCAEPTSALREIWAAGGVGPARLAVMHRVRAPKAYLLGRYRNGPAAAAFVALHDGIAMLHALEVGPAFRRRGVGRMMSAAAAGWARAQGAHTLALLVLRANAAAIGLYKGMGLVECAAYHYRKKLERTK